MSPKKLLVVCHPDDEAIFFGDWLIENAKETKVICLTCRKDETRFKELEESLKTAGVKDFECLKEPASLEPFRDKDHIRAFLTKIKKESNWEMIVTHNRYGEYGHMQHIEAHEIVRDIFPNDKIYVYKNSSKRLPTNRKQTLLDKHESQRVLGINEIRTSECTGSDWYKHTKGFNMIDYESIVRLDDAKDLCKIILFWGGSSDHTSFDFIKKLRLELKNRGHFSTVSRAYPSCPHGEEDMSLVFRLEDARLYADNNEKFFFFLEDDLILDLENHKECRELIDKSVRSFTQSKYLRNFLGDSMNLVFVKRSRSWYTLVRKIEAHLLMGLTSATLAQSGRASDL